MHLRVDAVLVPAADRDLQLVARRRQVERRAEVHERARHRKRERAPHTAGLGLRLLAQPLRLEQRGEGEPEDRTRKPRPAAVEKNLIRSGSR